jgi:hypothetical protein
MGDKRMTMDLGTTLNVRFNEFTHFIINPTTDITVDFGNRGRDFIIENTSTLYMLGDIKPKGKASYSRLGYEWIKNDINKGEKKQYIEFANPANNALQVTTEILLNTDVLWVKNNSTRTDHQFNLNIRPTKQNQLLTIYLESGSRIVINFGTPYTVVGSVIHENATAIGGTTNTAIQTSVDVTNNTAVILKARRFMRLRGMVKPVTDDVNSYHWVVEDGNSLEPA